jgi:hypothetical protein
MKAKVTLTAMFFLVALTMLAVHTVAESQVVTDGLVMYLTFDDADIQGITVNDVWGNNDGALVGDPQIVPGKVNEALEFDGEDDYVEVPDDASLQLWETYTLEAWIYEKEIRSSRFIDKCTAGTSDGPHFDNHPGTKLRACSGGCVTSDADFTLDAWYHVVNTFDNGDVKFYMDGVLVGEGAAESPLTGNDLSFKVAADSNGANLFLGIIDEVRVYNRALSEAEVGQNFAADGLDTAAINPGEKLAHTWGEIKAAK